MRRAAYALFAALLATAPLAAQTRAVWVFFRDKGPHAAAALDTVAARTLGLSDEALRRRARTAGLPVDGAERGDDILRRARALRKAGESAAVVDTADLPVPSSYLAAVRASGVRVRAVSRWMDAVSVEADPAQERLLRALPCVRELRPVARWKGDDAVPPPFAKPAQGADHKLTYGPSLTQLEVIDVPKVHDIWIDGTGITVGMLDTGFRWRTHQAMQGLRVRGEYDFINEDSVTANEPGDSPGQDGHGTLTFSALAGWKDSTLFGPAFKAAFYLAKTEVVQSETRIEEDYYAEGIEWLEANGCAVTSSSLAYGLFDDSTGYSSDTGSFAGKTAVTPRAAARAARLGVVVVTAMGNEGNRPGTILAPADADSILSIGAVASDGTIAGFSSNGPTNDGRTKPDLVAPGVAVFSAANWSDSAYTYSSGTSLATPLAAGAAALVRSARPELTPIQVRDALRNTADQHTAPDNTRGWGLIDAWSAVLYYGMVISTDPKVVWTGARNVVATYVVSPNPVVENTVRITYSVNGGPDVAADMVFTDPYPGYPSGSGLYTVTLPVLPKDALVRYYLEARDAKERRTSPYGAPDVRHEFRAGSSETLGVPNLLPASFDLSTNFPNPVRADGTAYVRYAIPDPGARVRLALYDSLGRLVRVFLDERRDTGVYLARVPTDGLASGAYSIEARALGRTIVRRMALVR